MLTIPEIINVAKISGYLADNAVDANKVFVFGSLDKDLPKKIYMESSALEWAYNQNYVPTSAIATFAIEGIVTYEDISFQVQVQDPVHGLITIGTYTLAITDTTLSILATHLAAAINAYGYSATSNNNLVTVTAPLNLGNAINGISLNINLT